MKWNWRVSHQRTVDDGLNVLVVEQWPDDGLGGALNFVYIPPESLDRFVEKVLRLAPQVQDADARQDDDESPCAGGGLPDEVF